MLGDKPPDGVEDPRRLRGEWKWRIHPCGRSRSARFESQIEALEAKIATAMEPYADLVELLRAIPGVDRLVAWMAIAEMGVDMSFFRKPRIAPVGLSSVRGATKARASR
jgi:transposase